LYELAQLYELNNLPSEVWRGLDSRISGQFRHYSTFASTYAPGVSVWRTPAILAGGAACPLTSIVLACDSHCPGLPGRQSILLVHSSQ